MTKKISADSMHIENFKGLPSLDIEFGDTQTDIYGDNATGKTTVADAFHWVLFGKDSENQTAFGIKPLRSDGQVAQHGAVTSVTVSLTVDGETCELKKEYAEKWVKKRGSTNPIFSGHETSYSIDGVPKKKTEYEAYVKKLLDEDTFRILTSPTYFASVLPWQKRRDILMNLGGSISDMDVLAANEELEPLRAELEKYGHADLIKKLKADRQRINKKRTELPVRIDEARKSIIEGIDEDAERAALDAVRDEIEAAQVELAELQAGGAASEIASITAKIAKLREAVTDEGRQRMADYNEAVSAFNMERTGYEQRIRDTEREIRELDASVESVQMRVAAMRDEYAQARGEAFTDDGICPTCGQPIPDEQMADKREKFNISKSQHLEALASQGRTYNEQIASAQKRREALSAALASEQEGAAALVPPVKPEAVYDDTPEIEALIARRNEIEGGSERARKDAEADVQRRLAALRQTESAHIAQLSAIDAARTTKERIAQLESDERTLAAEIERLDGMIYACEQFTRTKVDLLESRINGLFRVVRWRLFREQINGGLDECCDLTVQGVPWADLNSAMRINAGIDVINALSAYYDVSAPVIIDNAETVTALEPLHGQLIRLVVSEPDKTLRIVEVA